MVSKRLNKKELEYILNETLNKLVTEKSSPIKYSYDDTLEFIKDDNIVDGGNFGIRRNGKDYWVSRSNIVTLYVFCKSEEYGEWCVLASKRGSKAKFSNYWNVVCGFLDYGFSLEDTAVKECYEETGVQISKDMLINKGTFSDKLYDSVNTVFTVVFNDDISNHPTSIENCEPGEVSEAVWVPLSQVSKLKWSGKQGIFAKQELKKLSKNTFDSDIENIEKSLTNMVKRNIINVEKMNNILNMIKNG
jgi:ADP-ribose pyrophosphatase YjhB (NUDIX family)